MLKLNHAEMRTAEVFMRGHTVPVCVRLHRCPPVHCSECEAFHTRSMSAAERDERARQVGLTVLRESPSELVA